ncbi:MAG: hypothetical protein R2828_29615 [Saprospiraceae bacterium]
MEEFQIFESTLVKFGKDIIIEGVNTDDWEDSIKSHMGMTSYLVDITIPKSNRCAMLIALDYWQGHNGSEDITAIMKDYLFFDKRDLIKVILLALKNPLKEAFIFGKGERIKDDGFWEDGIPCFPNATHIKDVPIEIKVQISGQATCEIKHQSKINPHWIWSEIPKWKEKYPNQ